MTNSWIICETTGRWAAALRIAIAHPKKHANAKMPRRICEVRSLKHFQSAIGEEPFALGLVEARLENLADIFELLSSERRPPTPIAALLHDSLERNANSENGPSIQYQAPKDALREAGALEVIDSPRRISELLGLAECLAATSSLLSAAGRQASFAERAWAAVPWQDE
jgi:hypothetical protein